jgi:hypothetical protein
MRSGHQDLNIIFFTFRSCRPRQAPCRPLRERQAPIFENFSIRHIFLKFCFFKYKNKKSAPGCPLPFDADFMPTLEPNACRCAILFCDSSPRWCLLLHLRPEPIPQLTSHSRLCLRGRAQRVAPARHRASASAIWSHRSMQQRAEPALPAFPVPTSSCSLIRTERRWPSARTLTGREGRGHERGCSCRYGFHIHSFKGDDS